MRGPLSVLHASLQKMIQTDMPGTALLNQSYYQLLRLAGNLSMAELLDGEHYLRKRENGDIVVFCRELAEQVGLLAEEQDVTVQFSCAAQSCVIAYDARLMERLLLNLFSNALKFTGPGGKVTLTVQVHKSDVLLSVEDTGPMGLDLAFRFAGRSLKPMVGVFLGNPNWAKARRSRCLCRMNAVWYSM